MESQNSTKTSSTSPKVRESIDFELPILPACASDLPSVPIDVVLAWCDELLPQFQISAEEALRDKVNVPFVL
jgi:hypothetical protein